MELELTKERYTVPELAPIFEVDVQTVRIWVRGGKFPNAIKKYPGNTWLIPRSDVITFARKRYHGEG